MRRIQAHIEESSPRLPLHPAATDLFDRHGPSMYALLLRGCASDHQKAEQLMEIIFLAFNGSLHVTDTEPDRHFIRLLRIAIQHSRAHDIHLAPVIRELLASGSSAGNDFTSSQR